MTQGFESVQHELDQKRLQIEQELTAVRGREGELEADLARVHEALGALTGHKKKASSRGRSRDKKPASTVQGLQQHIATVRSQNPFADATALEKAVRELVKEAGTSQNGFKQLFAEALLTSPGSGGSVAHAGSHSHASSKPSHGHSSQGGQSSHGQSSHGGADAIGTARA